MTRLVATIALCAFAAVSAGASPAPDGPFQSLDASPLLTMQESAEPSLVWAEYERFMLSRSRATPLLLFFTPVSACYSEEEQGDDEDAVDEAADAPTAAQEACERHAGLVEAAVQLAAETLPAAQLRVVRVDVQTWPKMLHYHLVSSTPSLLWLPGRASGRFQRYPHVDTNFLDLSATGPLFASKAQSEAEKAQGLLPNQGAKDALSNEIAAFVRLCQERSGYLTRNARGRLSPTVPASVDDDALAGLELILIVALLAFLALVVNENREFVLGVVRTRLFWFALCLGVIYVALSGLFHSIIHRRAWYYFGRMHGFVFVHPSSRQQFVLEGLVNGTWSFWLSLGAMSISEVMPTLRSRAAKGDVIMWSLLLVAVSYMALHLTFLMKYRWLA